ncbi:MAG TPA: DUF4397 domain-containing protein [Chitinophaga sp.]|uniref:DUF4397 domain-containing protein n=1 Tax=Chitinophaga sp. TaxID=1869181 RepID=UPI002DB6B036|nr:DUF4397 domain-containing protein [Chitinophaga sp.]HEU4553060.1 DUF4397 domain-containing protein [Chitinophaga sp.]
MKKWIRPALIICLLAVAVACSKDSDSDLPDTHSGVRVFQMVPDANARFDFKLDTITLGSNLGYGENTGAYKQFRAEKHNFYIYPAGSSTPIMGGELTLRNGYNLSAYLTVDHLDTLRLLVTQDDLTPPTGPGNAHIKYINLCDTYVKVPNSTRTQPLALDFYFDYADRDSLLVYRSVGFANITDVREILATSYKVNFNFRDSSLVLQTAQMKLDSGKVYTLVTTGNANDATFKMWTFQNN